jgi:hypothetical protein
MGLFKGIRSVPLPDLFDIVAVAGIGLTAYGAWLYSEPLGYITGGVLLMLAAVVGARGAKAS